MEDERIIMLYKERSECAISETETKYGKYCRCIANNILRNDEDSEECVADAYMKVWESIPPNEPPCLRTYLAKIVRNLALNRYQYTSAKKRRFDSARSAIDELEIFISSRENTDSVVDEIALGEVLNAFLRSLSVDARKIFMRRYWYMDSVKDIAKGYKMSEGKVKMSLHRSRKLLRQTLEKEGFFV